MKIYKYIFQIEIRHIYKNNHFHKSSLIIDYSVQNLTTHIKMSKYMFVFVDYSIDLNWENYFTIMR